ncbi:MULTISPECIES: hypothetical protein [unclassified Rhizobium]|uniref:hypothetical protein n=1 Tax=unclassified Rhizobium TaxID=2613769 RepID=UPI0013C43D79|nr:MULTISPECIES: hypothetical protein [unclassified Rhizobium]
MFNFLLLSAGYVNTFAGKAFAAFHFWLKLMQAEGASIKTGIETGLAPVPFAAAYATRT